MGAKRGSGTGASQLGFGYDYIVKAYDKGHAHRSNSGRGESMKHSGLRCTAAVTALLATQMAVATNPPNPNDLTQGLWELQPAKSHFCEPGPLKSMREITDVGWGFVSTHFTNIDAKGGLIDIRYVYRYDGQKYPFDIVKRSDFAITWKLVDASHVEFVDWQNDQIIATNVRAVSADGQVMMQTTKHVTGTAKGCTDSQVFARQWTKQ